MTQRPSAYVVLPGDPTSPVILHVPHASTVVPPDVRSGILLDDAGLALELARLTDAHTDRIASDAAARVPARPWQLVNRLSRLVIDPERFSDESEEMTAVGMGAVYTSTSHGEPLRERDAARDAGLVAAYFDPYAEAMAALVDERLEAVGRAVIIDVHSYQTVPLPYEMHADGDRPAVCLGVDRDHTPDALVDLAAAAFAPLGDVGTNSPFAGTYVPLSHYQQDLRVHSLMVEIRRDTYMTEPGGPPTDGLDLVGAALARLLAEL